MSKMVLDKEILEGYSSMYTMLQLRDMDERKNYMLIDLDKLAGCIDLCTDDTVKELLQFIYDGELIFCEV